MSAGVVQHRRADRPELLRDMRCRHGTASGFLGVDHLPFDLSGWLGDDRPDNRRRHWNLLAALPDRQAELEYPHAYLLRELLGKCQFPE